jgi:hypothetical protein
MPLPHFVDRPVAPKRDYLTMKDARRFAGCPVLRNVAVYEFSNKVHHKIRLQATLCFPLLCLGSRPVARSAKTR